MWNKIKLMAPSTLNRVTLITNTVPHKKGNFDSLQTPVNILFVGKFVDSKTIYNYKIIFSF